MNTRATGMTALGAALLSFAVALLAANTMPLARAWNIRASGMPAANGELLFRVTSRDVEEGPVEVTVFVRSGSSEEVVAGDIRQALSAQLRPDRFEVRLGDGANVFVVDPRGRPNFSLELIDSAIDNLRVTVQPAEPIASPTVPEQSTPANPLPPSTPPQPGTAMPPAEDPQIAVPPTRLPPAAPPPIATPAPAPPGDGAAPAAPTPEIAPPPPGSILPPRPPG
jgi:hypothetical protein